MLSALWTVLSLESWRNVNRLPVLWLLQVLVGVIYDFKVADFKGEMSWCCWFFFNTTVLRRKATSLLSQCESLWVWWSTDMCMVYLLAVIEKRRDRGEPLRHWNQTAVCVTSESHAENRQTVHAPVNPSDLLACRVILSQDVRRWPQLLTRAMPQPQRHLQMEIQDVNGFETQMIFTCKYTNPGTRMLLTYPPEVFPVSIFQ